MKLSDVTKELNTSIEEIVQYYKEKRNINFPVDGDHILTFEQVKKAIPFFTKAKYDEYIGENNLGFTDIIETDTVHHLTNERKENKVQTEKVNIDYEINKELFNWSEKKIIQEILIENKLDKLILKGIYKADAKGGKFGFFTEVTDINDLYVSYPNNYGVIESVFVFSSDLEQYKKYTFEVQLAQKRNRKDKNNPFLLQAKRTTLKEVMELSELQYLIQDKQENLTQLQSELSNIESELQSEKEEVIQQVNRLKIAKQKEANEIIDEYNQSINDKYNELEKTKIELDKLKRKYVVSEKELNIITIKKEEMETTINFLQKKIEVCNNLEFLSKEEANNYLFQLNSNNFEIGNDYLDFENDLSANFPKLTEHILNYLYFKKDLIYTKFQISNFLSLILTNDLIVLSGLSGSGKTQIVKAFADAIGGVAKIIPVKPNWISSDDLLGYYNPIQSSFLPTPFTEAIVEAIQNPHQMYLICLDEMNLARVEYYFADFLSKLEEREKQPEIELYAKHEEELFLSEFKTLLTLIESSIGNNTIQSWKDFLENDKTRNRFFELLGNSEEDTLLQIHSKMKRRLIDILKFPSTIKIPNNIRFIGAINVDETTHYFSPKILDRVHIVKFENPLLFDDIVSEKMNVIENRTEIKQVYVHPNYFGKRTALPALSDTDYLYLTDKLKEINKKYLLPLSIDFGVRSIRQSINYAKIFDKVFNHDDDFSFSHAISFNSIFLQKILPRFLFEDAKLRNGENKTTLLLKLKEYLSDTILEFTENDLEIYEANYQADDYLQEMLDNAEQNQGQVNFWAVSSITNFEDKAENLDDI